MNGFEKDYYTTLGVSPDASDKEIQSKYRKLARELHPDRNPDDQKAEDRFKEVSTAYDVVGNPETRTQYDDVRRMGPSAMGGFNTHGNDFGNLNDLLNGMFGGAGNPFGAAGTQYASPASTSTTPPDFGRSDPRCYHFRRNFWSRWGFTVCQNTDPSRRR